MSDKKILIVDDEPINIHLLSSLLDPPYSILFATNGNDAVTRAIKQSPDLILLDIILPDISGYKVCKQLKENIQTSNIPVIFLSALDADQSVNLGLELGAVDYIVKPYDLDLVQRKVSSYL